jgi:hypothetical protein
MINLEKIKIRNFFSVGNVPVEIDVSNHKSFLLSYK